MLTWHPTSSNQQRNPCLTAKRCAGRSPLKTTQGSQALRHGGVWNNHPQKIPKKIYLIFFHIMILVLNTVTYVVYDRIWMYIVGMLGKTLGMKHPMRFPYKSHWGVPETLPINIHKPGFADLWESNDPNKEAFLLSFADIPVPCASSSNKARTFKTPNVGICGHKWCFLSQHLNSGQWLLNLLTCAPKKRTNIQGQGVGPAIESLKLM